MVFGNLNKKNSSSQIELKKLISELYYEILDRAPDKEGLNYYYQLMNKEQLTAFELAHKLRTSDEYRILQTKSPKKHDLNKIKNYIKYLPKDHELRVIFGGHWSDHAGWLILDEVDQDITKSLNFDDESVDVIFTEHVIEHLTFGDAMHFLVECERIIKSGGVFRVVCPMIEKFFSNKFDDRNSKLYVEKSLIPDYKIEDELLRKMKLNGIFESPKTFHLNSMFLKHGHKFIWSSELMSKVLKSIGFSKVKVVDVGKGINPNYCIERRTRGLYEGNNWKEDLKWGSEKFTYDPESLIIESIK